MSELRISLELPSDRWVVGSPYAVKVRLHNEGALSAEVPTTLSPSEFEFRFSSAQLQIARVLSGKARRLSRRPDPAPVPRFVEPLAAGASAEYTENLAEYAQPALAPGSYQLTVRWTRGAAGQDSSPEATVQVVAPRVVSLATAADASGTLAVLWGDERGADQIVLMQREGARGDPAADAASERVTLATGAAPTLALAVAANASRGVRWCAWIDAGALGTRLAQGGTVFAAPPPLPLGIGRPRLHPIGWQPTAETVHFLALGDEVAEQAALAIVTQPADDDASIRVAKLATGGPVLRWAAQWGASVDAFAVVTAAATTSGVRVVVHAVAGDARVVQSRTLLERGEALQAMALAPLAGAGPGHVDLIFGPSASMPPRVSFLRLPLDGGPPLIELLIPVPADAAGQPATGWALAPTDAALPQVVVRLGEQIIGKVLAAGGRGFVLARGAAGAQDLRLEKVGDTWWAVWIDPAQGLRYARLPDLA